EAPVPSRPRAHAGARILRTHVHGPSGAARGAEVAGGLLGSSIRRPPASRGLCAIPPPVPIIALAPAPRRPNPQTPPLMRITCPRCLRSLSATPDTGPPAFCMYCGQKLRDSSDDTPTATTPAQDHHSPSDQHTGTYVPTFMDRGGEP